MILKDHEEGTKKIFHIKAVREADKKVKNVNKANWYRQGTFPFASTLNIPAKSGSSMANVVENAISKYQCPDGMKTKVVEVPKKTICQGSMRPDPCSKETDIGKDAHCVMKRKGVE